MILTKIGCTTRFYMSDARKVAQKMETVIRHPIKKA